KAERLSGPAEVRLENLADVHAARDAERIEDDLNRCAVRQIRHVLPWNNLGDHAFVAMAPRHLVADRQGPLDRDKDFDHLEHPGRKLVTGTEPADFPIAVSLDLA